MPDVIPVMALCILVAVILTTGIEMVLIALDGGMPVVLRIGTAALGLAIFGALGFWTFGLGLMP